MSMFKTLLLNQPDLTFLLFEFNGFSGDVLFGRSEVSVIKNATGVYTVGAKASTREFIPWVFAWPIRDTPGYRVEVRETGSTTAGARIECFNETGAAANSTIRGMLICKTGKHEA